MNEPPLPLEIASGILLAVVIVWLFKVGVHVAAKRDENFAAGVLAIIGACLLGGGFIAAGLGLVAW